MNILKKLVQGFKKKQGILKLYKRIRTLYKNVELCDEANIKVDGMSVIDYYPQSDYYVIKLNGFHHLEYFTAFDEFRVELDCRTDFNGWFKFDIKPTDFEINPYSQKITLQMAMSVLEQTEKELEPYVKQAKKVLAEREAQIKSNESFFEKQEEAVAEL